MVSFNLKPTEAITVYSLIVTGIVGSVGTMVLAQAIKDKQVTPINPLIYATVFTILATAASVYLIAKQSKDQPVSTLNQSEKRTDVFYNKNPMTY